ncbi:hypothetical protein LTR56_002589 [Elasticomyces elasticus]|nr:hypothetical protein LTR22_013491 [Elasticomyces elasticus]KAK3657075.1 hypothetical protein LTR56_002589 [Elasticomyces elasticus]KAK4926696.1 hypothetical protein LTR49_006378 [Elasticomyces elasticus]KAK5762353.1 hypothetical protein LTS12_007512 [Elasticomyces elasticus]
MDDLDSLKQEYGAALPPSLRPGATGRSLQPLRPIGLRDNGAISQNFKGASTFAAGREPNSRSGVSGRGAPQQRVTVTGLEGSRNTRRAAWGSTGPAHRLRKTVDERTGSRLPERRLQNPEERPSKTLFTNVEGDDESGLASAEHSVAEVDARSPNVDSQEGPPEHSSRKSSIVQSLHASDRPDSLSAKFEEWAPSPPPPQLQSDGLGDDDGSYVEIEECAPSPPPPQLQSDGLGDDGGSHVEIVDISRPPRRGSTRMPKRLANEEVLRNLGYTFYEQAGVYVINKPLDKVSIDHIVEASTRHTDEPSPVPADQMARPVHMRVHLDQVEIPTLYYYNLPYTADPNDPNYIIIRREMSEREIKNMFEHTRRFRDPPTGDNEPNAVHPLEAVEQFWREYVPTAEHAMDQISRTNGVLTASANSTWQFAFPESMSDINELLVELNLAWYRRRDQPWKNLWYYSDVDDESMSTKSEKDVHLEDDVASESLSTLKCVVHSTFSHADNRGMPKQQTPLFRTLENYKTRPEAALFFVKHIQQKSLDFESFTNDVLALVELQDLRSAVEDHLTHDWTLEDEAGRTSSRMKVSPRTKNNPDAAITAACLTFVYSDTHSRPSRNSAKENGAHTLFQFLYPKGDRRQDLNQALCNMQGPHKNRILYTTQLWAVIINKDILITCAIMSEAELYGTLLSPVLLPATNESSSDIADIRVTSPDGKLWLLQRSNCKTFLEFVSHFSDVSLAFCDDFTIYLAGEVISPREWHRVHQVSNHPIAHLTLRRCVRGPIREQSPWPVCAIELLFGQEYESSKNAMLRDAANGLDLRCVESTLPHPSANSAASLEPRRILSALKESFIDSVSHITSPAKSKPDQRTVDSDYSSVRLPQLPASFPLIRAQDFNKLLSEWVEDVATRSAALVQGETILEQGKLEALFLELEVEVKDADHDAPNDDAESLPDDALIYVSTDSDTTIASKVQPMDLLVARCDLIYANIFNGIISISGLFRHGSGSFKDGLPNFLGVLFNFATAINDIVSPRPKLWSADLLLRVWQCLEGLLTTGLLLEPYGFTCQHMPPKRAHRIFSSLLLDLDRVTTSIQDLDDLYERLCLQQPSETVGTALYRLKADLRRLKSDPHERSSERQRCIDSFEVLRDQTAAYAAGPRSINMVLATLQEIETSIHKSTRQLTTSFETHLLSNTSPLSAKAAPEAADLLTTLLERTTHLQVSQGGDAQKLYMAYMTELEYKVSTGETSRESLERLRYLKHELNAFSQLQTAQGKALEEYYAQVQPEFLKSDDDDVALEAPVPDKSFARGAWQLYSLIDELQKDNYVIQLLDSNIKPLQDECRAQLNSKEDWRNNAGVVFTVITILFLPPSFVASVLGMNTADIRDTAHGQWIYWATAIPLTVVVIAVTLRYVDVPPLRRWWARRKEQDLPWTSNI